SCWALRVRWFCIPSLHDGLAVWFSSRAIGTTDGKNPHPFLDKRKGWATKTTERPKSSAADLRPESGNFGFGSCVAQPSRFAAKAGVFPALLAGPMGTIPTLSWTNGKGGLQKP